MGINDEYSRDAHMYELAYDDESDDLPESNELDEEDWQDMYSTELLDAWMKIRDFVESNYIKIDAGYPQFVDLVIRPYEWVGSSDPTPGEQYMWRQIKDIPVISERLSYENFYKWTEKYIKYI